MRIKFSKPRIKKATQNASNWGRALLQTWIKHWLLVVRNRDAAVSALVFKTKATEFAEKLNVENFKASHGWLDRWKKQFNMSFKTVSGESNACTDEMIAPWEQTTLPTILYKYYINQIFNAEEFGLFFCAQPNKSLHWKNEKCIGGKHSKLHLTRLTAVNKVGKKLPLFVIGKSERKSERNLDVSNI